MLAARGAGASVATGLAAGCRRPRSIVAAASRAPPAARAAAMMARMDRSIAWRAALLQAVLVAGLAVILAVALPRSFFQDWGWLAGPGAWALCALAVAAATRLPALPVLVGAALAGLPSLATVLAGAHWLGAPVAIALFALWCGRLAARRRSVRTAAA
jgi:hypothetical protein